jgi:hypothetical protein
MNNSTLFSARGGLVFAAEYIKKQKMWEEIERHVDIKQKTIVHRPIDKLLDAFINILAAGKGIVEINTRVRPDEGLQRAFGRQGCADQSGVSTTLNRVTKENVEEMRTAMKKVLQAQSQANRHEKKGSRMIMDVDMTGLPAGARGEGVSKGFFSGSKNRRGRQLGRVIASEYKELIVEKLYPGKVQLERSFKQLVLLAMDVLNLDTNESEHLILRVDGGGGRDADINWSLETGFGLIVKVHNWKRAAKLARSVTTWVTDPSDPSREYGWVEAPFAYCHATNQVALRKRSKDDKWQYRIIVTNLSEKECCSLARMPRQTFSSRPQFAFAIIRAYDLRGGGIETSIKESKQGLGITKRNKRSFYAQEMLILLAQLAYNLIIWMRREMVRFVPFWAQIGILRFVRDAFSIRGKLLLDSQGRLLELSLDQNHPLAEKFLNAIAIFSDDLPSYLCKI